MSEPYDGMPITDDAGEVVGHAFQIDDGGWAMVRDGEIVTALDAEGNDLDPAEFAFEPGEFDDPRANDLAAEIEELRYRIENPEPLPTYVPGPTQEEMDAQYASMLGREIENLEAIAGRKLSDAEAHRIYSDHRADVEAGIEPNLAKSVALANLADTSTHDGRVQFMGELVREESGDVDHSDPRPPRVEPASSDPGDVRRAAITNAVHGHDDEPGPTSDWGEEGIE